MNNHIQLLPNERCILRTIKWLCEQQITEGRPAGVTWNSIVVQARLPMMNRNLFTKNGLIENVGTATHGLYVLTEKGIANRA